MSKPAGQYIGKDFSSKETQEAIERLHDDTENLKIIPNFLEFYTFNELYSV